MGNKWCIRVTTMNQGNTNGKASVAPSTAVVPGGAGPQDAGESACVVDENVPLEQGVGMEVPAGQ